MENNLLPKLTYTFFLSLSSFPLKKKKYIGLCTLETTLKQLQINYAKKLWKLQYMKEPLGLT